MTKRLIIALLSIISINSYCQITFEKGYFINETDQKIECYIKNIDWKNNPTEFDYKFTLNETAKRGTIQTVKEFGINDAIKYIRSTVKIDRSKDNTGNLSTDRVPNFREELLYLRVIIEGQASLLYYRDGNLTRFFYQLNNSEITQLVHKRYLINNKVAQNNLFRQQLLLALKCKDIRTNDITKLSYERRSLKRIFIQYNSCNNYNYTNYEPKNKKDLFSLSLRPSISFSSLNIDNTTAKSFNTDFESKTTFRLGVETEFILPFNKNKWSIVIEPTYQYFKAENRTQVSYISGGELIKSINYQSIELPVGIRHYFFLSNYSKVFANISFISDFTLGSSSIDFKRNDGSTLNSLKIKPRKNFALGVGYKHKDRFSIEIRYQTRRDILGSYLSWYSNYKTTSIIFGYSLR
ncbi:MAG: hypothetical protein JW783_06705 [Bacteroidales bacterium]|nr:hypothetical protein [Bacteroidales bacterium]MBN2750513.1 hypothetical protein [Bacteroidales bacterium]